MRKDFEKLESNHPGHGFVVFFCDQVSFSPFYLKKHKNVKIHKLLIYEDQYVLAKKGFSLILSHVCRQQAHHICYNACQDFYRRTSQINKFRRNDQDYIHM